MKARIYLHVDTDLKEKIREEANERGLTMTSYLLACRIFFLKLQSVEFKGVPMNTTHERPWEFDEPKPKHKGRVLPLIPGTEAWKKAQFYMNKMDMVSELKEKLKLVKKKINE